MIQEIRRAALPDSDPPVRVLEVIITLEREHRGCAFTSHGTRAQPHDDRPKPDRGQMHHPPAPALAGGQDHRPDPERDHPAPGRGRRNRGSEREYSREQQEPSDSRHTAHQPRGEREPNRHGRSHVVGIVRRANTSYSTKHNARAPQERPDSEDGERHHQPKLQSVEIHPSRGAHDNRYEHRCPGKQVQDRGEREAGPESERNGDCRPRNVSAQQLSGGEAKQTPPHLAVCLQ